MKNTQFSRTVFHSNHVYENATTFDKMFTLRKIIFRLTLQIWYANVDIKHLYCSTKRKSIGRVEPRRNSSFGRYFSSRLQPRDKRLSKCDRISIKFMSYNNDCRYFIYAPHKILQFHWKGELYCNKFARNRKASITIRRINFSAKKRIYRDSPHVEMRRNFDGLWLVCQC